VEVQPSHLINIKTLKMIKVAEYGDPSHQFLLRGSMFGIDVKKLKLAVCGE